MTPLKPISPDVIQAIHRNLQDFGYTNLSLEHVQKAVDGLIASGRPTGIIAMFAENMLRKNGYLAEEV